VPSLKDRMVLVAGRTSGIARAIAFALGENGDRVVAAGRHPDVLADTEPAGVTDEIATASAPVAISPAIGPLPAISVARPGQAGSTGLLGRVPARSARRAREWATRHLSILHLPRPGR
jgi:NAD(P)-dependent dehydrogenase (short-subunit alcohol dehydrogenase family)